METRTELSAHEIPGGRVSLWGIDPDGRTLVISRLQRPRPLTAGEVGRTRLSIWDLAKNQEIHGADIVGAVDGAVMSADGSRVAWGLSIKEPNVARELRVWDAKTGREEWSRVEPGDTTQYGTPVFSRDGRNLVVATVWGSGRKQVYVLDAATGRELRPPLFSPDGTLRDLRISADGRRLFALASQRDQPAIPTFTDAAVVWDLVTGRKLLTLPAENATALTIDREGRRIYLVLEYRGSGKLELETFDGTPLPDPAK